MIPPYLATQDGEDVLDKSEIISDQIIAHLVVGLKDQGFEATITEWTDGVFLAFEFILSAGSEEARELALERMRQLVTGEVILE